MSSQNALRETLMKCLIQQQSELEVLKSMYPNEDEIIFTDNNSLEEINNFVHNNSYFDESDIPKYLDFTLNLFANELKLEVCINLPSFYPEEVPDVYVRCNKLNRHEESHLNQDLSDFIKKNHSNDICLHIVIAWLQENIDNYNNKNTKFSPLPETSELNNDETKFVRIWVYSHHIYNKKKRDEIQKLAKELKLTGFCLSGKPGIICVEGLQTDCNEWWKHIKSMTWKKIVIRKTETLDIHQQKFHHFEELSFTNMSIFSKFMTEKGFACEFNEFFGLSKDQ